MSSEEEKSLKELKWEKERESKKTSRAGSAKNHSLSNKRAGKEKTSLKVMSNHHFYQTMVCRWKNSHTASRPHTSIIPLLLYIPRHPPPLLTLLLKIPLPLTPG
jgi:hypothetical protein